MATLVFVDLKPKPSELDSMLSYIREIIADTRSFDGCHEMLLYLEGEGEGVMFVERWESQAHYDKYLAWRIETGVMEKLGAMLDSPPIIRFAEDSGI